MFTSRTEVLEWAQWSADQRTSVDSATAVRADSLSTDGTTVQTKGSEVPQVSEATIRNLSRELLEASESGVVPA